MEKKFETKDDAGIRTLDIRTMECHHRGNAKTIHGGGDPLCGLYFHMGQAAGAPRGLTHSGRMSRAM